MESVLIPLYDKAMKALGPIAGFVPTIAKSLKVAIKAGDLEKVQAHVTELKEASAALGGVASHIEAAIADGEVSLDEGAALALKFEKFIDELEDVIKGYDEDKPAASK